MIIRLVCIPFFVAISACSSSADDGPNNAELENLENEMAEEAAKLGGLDAISYPKCGALWKGSLTSCGKETFKISLDECQKRAVETGGPLLDRKSAGESWVQAAGPHAVASVDERMAGLSEADAMSTLQFIATVPGDGERVIKSYSCSMRNLKLEHVEGYVKPVTGSF